ncbi:LuxR C-terminal-related transcriptional regulator [Terrabacter sp. NPDC080008]|uniref:helix-turn-helix transcriptional regulator n=1 Tax=Terrabacter sp. NPDC080008 TaxID=3155176 RepID=UPI00345032EE
MTTRQNEDTDATGATPAPESSTSAVDLIAAAVEVTTVVNDLSVQWLSARPTPGFRLLGTGTAEIERHLAAAIEPVTRRSVWSMQPHLPFDPGELMRTTDDRSRGRGLDMRGITTERTVLTNPLISSEHPDIHIGPAHFQCIVVDEVTAVVAGPNDDRGFQTAWLATRPDVVARVVALWHRTWERSRPVLAAGAKPPFTPRQCVVARRLVVGTKDAAIARELGISRRTVATDIADLVRRLGASNRAAAVLALRGGTYAGTHRASHATARADQLGEAPGLDSATAP